MTVILAVRDGSVVLMSADCAGVDDDGILQRRRDSKLFKLLIPSSRETEMLIGFAGNWAMGQALANFKPPFWSYGSAHDYLVKAWVPALRHWRGEEIPLQGLTLLVALDAQIFKIFEDGQVAQAVTEFDAIGDVALGAMAAGWEAGLRSWKLIDMAAGVAAEFCSNVRGPFMTIPCFR